VDMLVASKSVVTPYMMQGRVGVTLAENRALLPMYAIPGLALAPAQLEPTLASLSAARYVLLPTAEFDGLISAASSRTDTESPTAMRRPRAGTDYGLYSMLTAFPLRTHAAHPVYEPRAVLGKVLERDWEVDHESGGYTILRKKPGK
jgi:hypothetical protein